MRTAPAVAPAAPIMPQTAPQGFGSARAPVAQSAPHNPSPVSVIDGDKLVAAGGH